MADSLRDALFEWWHGEFHTFVYDGPIFKNPIPIEIGEIVYRKYTPVKQKEDSGYDCEEKQEESGADPFEFGFWYCDILLKKSDKLASFNSL